MTVPWAAVTKKSPGRKSRRVKVNEKRGCNEGGGMYTTRIRDAKMEIRGTYVPGTSVVLGIERHCNENSLSQSWSAAIMPGLSVRFSCLHSRTAEA